MNQTRKKYSLRLTIPLLLISLFAKSLNATIYVVTNVNNNGSGSFRQAVLDANTNSGMDTIEFNISGTGNKVIRLNPTNSTTDEIVIDEQVLINGWSQDSTGFPSLPPVQLDCNNMASSGTIDALQINTTAASSIIDGLSIVAYHGSGCRILAMGCVIRNCTFGLDLDGETVIRSGYGANGAITLSASNTRIDSCVLSGQEVYGILLHNTADNSQVSYCKVGTDVTGTKSADNKLSGIYLLSSVDSVLVANNLISCNIQRGILLNGSDNSNCPTNTIIIGNKIGTDITGMKAMGNNQGIVSIRGLNIVIGGRNAADRNIISGNTLEGIRLSAGRNIQVYNNYIGTALNGADSLSNGGKGIFCSPGGLTNKDGYSHKIGGIYSNQGNVIAYNGSHGIEIINTTNSSLDSISILSNRIFSNAGMGISLEDDDAVTTNDINDSDNGPNGLLNFPIGRVAQGSQLYFDFDLDVPLGRYRIEVFGIPAGQVDDTKHGEGNTFLGYFNVTHPGGGLVNFIDSIVGAVPVGSNDSISFTTTTCLDSNCTLFGGTSEFSGSVPISTVVLPIQLANFTAQPDREKVRLVWSTYSESNTQRFEILRMLPNQTQFTKIGEMGATGNSNMLISYSYHDSFPNRNQSHVFYKLRIIDFDGETTYSKLCVVYLPNSKGDKIEIYPNPTTAEKGLFLKTKTTLSKKELTYKVVSVDGRILNSNKVKTGNQLKLPNLKSGTYYIQLYENSDLIYNELFLIE